ncbi:MAG: cytochrome P450 [Acidimicrobiales bacterium]
MSRFLEPSVLRFLADPKARADPYPMYARVREADPIHHSVIGVTLVTRYDDVLEVLRHPAMSSNDNLVDISFGAGRHGRGRVLEFPGRALFHLERRRFRNTETGLLPTMVNRFLILMDPPDHTRMRRLASRAFTPRVADAARPMIEKTALELLDQLEPRGGADLLRDYFYQLPTRVICDLLGVPPDDVGPMHDWVRQIVRVLDVSERGGGYITEVEAAAVELDRYFRSLIARRRNQPADDLLSALVAARDEGDQLSEEELVAFSVLLFAAGHETTSNLMGNGLWHLFANPTQLHRFRAEPDLRANAVDELVRFDSPIQLTQRVPTEPVEIGGVPLPARRSVVTVLGSANRDPTRFDQPDVLDLGRPDCQPMSFGFGIHHCLGAALARVEAEVGLGLLLDRFGDLRLVDTEPRWRKTVIFRGLESLPARWS